MKRKVLDGQIDLFMDEMDKQTIYKEKAFANCINCWCYDCKHNKYNDAIPRDLCGNEIPCPACDECICQGYESVCEIGSAKNGCSLRAKEEQIEN
jgi:hypothetical protein